MTPKHSTIASMLATASGIALLSAVSTEAAAPAKPAGFIKASIYLSTTGGLAFVDDAKYPNSPDGVWYPKRFEWYSVSDDDKPTNHPKDFGGLPSEGGINDGSKGNLEQFGTRIVGYFYPPSNGNYQFAISCDDPGSLYLSTNDDPANKVLLASEPVWNGQRSFGADDRRSKVDVGTAEERNENQSKLIALKAGQAYYIEAISKEGGGGDNLAVAYRLAADPPFDNDYKPIPGRLLSPLDVPTSAKLVGQPKNVSVLAGAAATFSIGLDLPPTVTLTSIQWKKNGANIPDSNTGAVTIATTLADNGAKIKAVVTTSGGSVESNEATLNVAELTKDFSAGAMKWEVYKDISGVAIAGMTDDPKYPASPDEVRVVGAYEGPQGYGDNYGARLSGFITPDATANYIFFCSADDNAQLFLSTDDSPANKKLIATEPSWNDGRQWLLTDRRDPDNPENRSDKFAATEWPTGNAIKLTAGKKYYTEFLYKEGGGGDNGAVIMIKEGDALPANGSPALSGGQIGGNNSVKGATASITKQPSAVTTDEGRTVTLAVDGNVTPDGFGLGLLVQWQKNGANISGANAKTLKIANSKVSDSGKYLAVVSAAGGASVKSTEVDVTVKVDVEGPNIEAVGAVKKGADIELGVAFDEAVDPATAGSASSYSLSKGTVKSARYVESAGGAVVVASGLAAGDSVTLTAKGVKDKKGNVRATTSKDAKIPAKLMTWVGVGGDELNVASSSTRFSDDVVARNEKDFDLISGGSQHWNNYDEETFVYQEITGDFDKVVRVEYEDPVTQWSRGGLNVREALDEGKTKADIDAGYKFSQSIAFRVNPPAVTGWDGRTGNNGYEVIHRPVEGGKYDGYASMFNFQGVGNSAPNYPNAWLRLKREGQKITHYRSDDGVTYIAIGNVTYKDDPDSPENELLADKLFVGMFWGPEYGNIGDEAIRLSSPNGIAKFRDYGDFGAAVVTPPAGGSITGIKINGANIVIDFTGSIQKGDSVTGPWTDVAGSGSVSVPASASAAFYRVKP